MNQDIAKYNTKETITKVLFAFLSRMSEGEKRFLTLNIIKKYLENKAIEITKRARTLFIIYSQKMRINTIGNLQKKFQKWKKFSVCPLNNTNTNMSNLLNSRSFLLENSSMRKEKEELKHCTFHPKINKNTNIVNSVPAHERLYSDFEKGKQRRILQAIEHEKKESEMASFSPSVSLNNYYTNSSRNFFERLEDFSKSKVKNKERKVNEIENEMNGKYTFSPNFKKNKKYLSSKKSKSISRSHSKSNYVINSDFDSTPAYVRLYEENARRKNYYHNLNNMINFNSVGNFTKFYNFSAEKKFLNNSKSHISVNDHTSIIRNLYEDHKKNQRKKHQLQKHFDEEQGITFQPKFISNNYKYPTKYNFDERNNKLLEDKKKVIDLFNQIQELNLSSQKVTKKVSQGNLEEIKKGLVERLYDRELEKILRKKSLNQEEPVEEPKNNITKPKIKKEIPQLMKENKEEAKEKILNVITENSVGNIEKTISIAEISEKSNKIKYSTSSEKNSFREVKDSKHREKENSLKNSSNSKKNNLNNLQNLNNFNFMNEPNQNTVKHMTKENFEKFVSLNEYTFGKDSKHRNFDKKYEYNFNEDFYLDNEVKSQEVSKNINFEGNFEENNIELTKKNTG